MLTEERFARILSILEEKGSVTANELMEELGASESTIRRDLKTLGASGELIKVHGGAMAKSSNYHTKDDDVVVREARHMEQKTLIGRYAAGLIEDGDVVYIDAGTTTERMMDTHINPNAVYVTNAITHAKRLWSMGCRTYILGGEFKGTTEAIVGEEAVASLGKYNFTKGFFGTNGMALKQGFTTPEIKEAMVKKQAMEHSKVCYILADDSKFEQIAAITFGDFASAAVITTALPENYREQANIIVVNQ